MMCFTEDWIKLAACDIQHRMKTQALELEKNIYQIRVKSTNGNCHILYAFQSKQIETYNIQYKKNNLEVSNYRMQGTQIVEESAVNLQQEQTLPKQQSKESIKRISNGYRSSKYFKRYISIQQQFIISIVVQGMLLVFYYEISVVTETNFTRILLFFQLAHSLIAVLINILKRQSFNDWKGSQLKQYQRIPIQSTIFTSLILLVQPYPFIENIQIQNWDYSLQIRLPLKLNYVLILFSYLKFGLLLQSIINISKFKKPRASRVCTIYGCQSSSLYAIKCYFIESPVKMIVLILVSALTIFAFAFRVCENNPQALDNPLKYYENTLWLVLVTMTSVGYGDVAPRTQWGRIIGFVCTFCGVLIVSVMILVVINTFELSTRQNNSLSLLNKVENKRKLKEYAGKIIRVSLWRLWKNYKNRQSNQYICQINKDKTQRIRCSEFSQALRASKFVDDRQMNIGEDMDREFQKANDYLERLDDNFDNMINHLSQKYFLNIQEIMNQGGKIMDKFGLKTSSFQQSIKVSHYL